MLDFDIVQRSYLAVLEVEVPVDGVQPNQPFLWEEPVRTHGLPPRYVDMGGGFFRGRRVGHCEGLYSGVWESRSYASLIKVQFSAEELQRKVDTAPHSHRSNEKVHFPRNWRMEIEPEADVRPIKPFPAAGSVPRFMPSHTSQ